MATSRFVEQEVHSRTHGGSRMTSVLHVEF